MTRFPALFLRHLALVAAFSMAFLICSTQTSRADQATDIAELQGMFEEFMKAQADAAETSNATLKQEGQVLVEPLDGYYAITLPHLTIEQEDGSYTDIGMVALNALPSDSDEEWKMTVAIPTPINHYSADKKDVVTINLGAQNFAGVWHKKFKNFVKMTALYQNISITDNKNSADIKIPEVKVLYNLQKGENNLWSGPADFTITGMNMSFPESGASGKVGQISIKSELKDYSIDSVLAYQEQIAALTETYESGETGVSGAHVKGLYNMIVDFISNAMDGFGFSVSVNDFVVNSPASGGKEAKHFNLSGAEYSFAMNGFRGNKVNTALRFSYDGLKIQPLTEELKQSAPDHINFDLRINNLPFKEIADLGRKSLQGVSEAPQAANMVGLQAIMILPQLLTQAQTSVILQDTSVGNDYYNLLTNGKLVADLQAVMGFTGDARAEIYGLDNLITNLQKAAADPEIDEDAKKKANDAIATLSVIKMVGQMAKDDQGRDIRSYDFNINQSGQAVMNGTDLQTLIQSTKGGK